MAPYLAKLGITRIADQTGLDNIGVPCFGSFRPASLTLSTNQGKGITSADAKASAVMEAAEYAVAERPGRECRLASLRDLQDEGTPVFWPARQLPEGYNFDGDTRISWLNGTGLVTQRPCLIPLDAVAFNGDARDLPGISQSTNGLASGNTVQEAVFHALCELIERDGYTRWEMLKPDLRNLTRFDPADLADPMLNKLVGKVVQGGKAVTFFDQTTDIGVPVVMALISDQGGGGHFDLAAGYGAHPDAVRAAIRAVTEAAQTRITSIAAARDDIAPSLFSKQVEESGHEIAFAKQTDRQPPASLPLPHLSRQRQLMHALKRAGLAEPIVVRLDDGSMPCAVVRVVSGDLEDREANVHWRPGIRASRWAA